jgi:hypothetical protein
MRTFRFRNENNLEGLRQERLQDVFDIEEFGQINRKARENAISEVFGTLLLQPFHFYFGRTAHFKSLHPYFRVSLRTAFIFGPWLLMRHISQTELEKMYKELLERRVKDQFEDSITAKYEILRR